MLWRDDWAMKIKNYGTISALYLYIIVYSLCEYRRIYITIYVLLVVYL